MVAAYQLENPYKKTRVSLLFHNHDNLSGLPTLPCPGHDQIKSLSMIHPCFAKIASLEGFPVHCEAYPESDHCWQILKTCLADAEEANSKCRGFCMADCRVKDVDLENKSTIH